MNLTSEYFRVDQGGGVDMKGSFFCRTRHVTKLIIGAIIASLVLLVAFSIRYPNLPKVLVYKAFREYVRISMTWKTRHWEEIEGQNFVLRFQSGDKNVAKMVLDNAEEAYVPVNNALDYYPRRKIPIILYPDTVSMNKSFGWAADESAMGVYWAGVIRVLSPNYWIEGGDIEAKFKSDGPMAHEYTHLIVDYLAGGNYPRWFTEGIAQREERKITGFEMALTGTEEIYPLSKMDAGYDLLPNQSAAYRQSLAMVDFLVERYGEDALKQILADLGKGNSMDGAFTNSIGINMQGFEAEFLHSIK